MFGVPPNNLPLVMYIGIFCYWVLLHYNMSFKTIPGSFTGVSDGIVHFLKIEKKVRLIHQNYLVALTFKILNLIS